MGKQKMFLECHNILNRLAAAVPLTPAIDVVGTKMLFEMADNIGGIILEYRELVPASPPKALE